LGAGQATAACSTASLKGTFGIQIGGATSSGMPVAALYLLKADGAGFVSGTGIQNKGGTVVKTTFSGTYVITSACVGTVQPETGDTFAFVLDNANTRLQVIQAASGDGVTSGAGFLQGTVACNVGGLNGTFGGAGILPGSATAKPPTKPTAYVGQATYNGKGGGTGTVLLNASGTILTGKSTSTYSVDSACFITSTVQTTVSFGSSVVGSSTTHGASLLVNNGNQLLSISTDATVSGGRSEK
jgi:hypothetical protein